MGDGLVFKAIRVKFDSGLEAKLSIDSGGLDIVSLNDRELTAEALHYMSSLAFLYLGSGLKGLVLEPQFLLDRANDLYLGFHNTDLDSFRSISGMSLEEFNRKIKQYESDFDKGVYDEEA